MSSSSSSSSCSPSDCEVVSSLRLLSIASNLGTETELMLIDFLVDIGQRSKKEDIYKGLVCEEITNKRFGGLNGKNNGSRGFWWLEWQEQNRNLAEPTNGADQLQW
ncbi:hypothetical protein L6452_32519 [Arctium lappa]|uniref:Uncharacterized protein n=1 Tax=Arctium lappa TaxID=4217 RepID=A0ACB8Z585_ARCLA|nr:hypothetical protein L6452_32519 [Arctium lappa]